MGIYIYLWFNHGLSIWKNRSEYRSDYRSDYRSEYRSEYIDDYIDDYMKVVYLTMLVCVSNDV